MCSFKKEDDLLPVKFKNANQISTKTDVLRQLHQLFGEGLSKNNSFTFGIQNEFSKLICDKK